MRMTEDSTFAATEPIAVDIPKAEGGQATENGRRPVRVWVDGCFDMMHYGHANALRQAREMGDILVAGIHSDADILKHKGLPVMNEDERYAAVVACKWADEVVPNAPYVTTIDMINKYNCDFVVHGDDLSVTADGADSYASIKAAGKFRECKRTQGISTTELVGRMLLMTREHHQVFDHQKGLGEDENNVIESFSTDSAKKSPYTGTRFFPTTRRIVQFSNSREAKPTDKVVYVDGGFDLFRTDQTVDLLTHYLDVGHIELLKRAKEMGDYLLVGVHDDQTINKVKGSNFPLMNLHERILGVLACRVFFLHVHHVMVSDVLEKIYKISVVVHGQTDCHNDIDGMDPYKLPKELGIYREVETPYSYLTSSVILQRIIERRQVYEERNRKKEAKELAILEDSGSAPKKTKIDTKKALRP